VQSGEWSRALKKRVEDVEKRTHTIHALTGLWTSYDIKGKHKAPQTPSLNTKQSLDTRFICA